MLGVGGNARMQLGLEHIWKGAVTVIEQGGKRKPDGEETRRVPFCTVIERPFPSDKCSVGQFKVEGGRISKGRKGS